MADDDEDYLSDKYLFPNEPQPSIQTSTYSERRKEAQRRAEQKNIQNRKKSRRQLEEETLREGLTTSLFERAKAEEEKLGTQNKAMSLMMKMGYKPGGSLGRTDACDDSDNHRSEPSNAGVTGDLSASPSPDPSQSVASRESSAPVTLETASSSLSHRKVPLKIDFLEGECG